MSTTRRHLQLYTPLKRPERHPPPSAVEIVLLAISAGLVCCIVPLSVAWPTVPDQVPRHFGTSSQPDAYGSKGAFLVLSVLAWATRGASGGS